MDLTKLLDHIEILNDSPILKGLALFLFYVILAKGLDLFIDRVLKRLASLTRVQFDDELLPFFHAPICWTVVLLGALHGLLFVSLPKPWAFVVPTILKTLILLVWWVAAFRVMHWLSAHAATLLERRGEIGHDIFLLLKNLIRVVLIALGIIWALTLWRVDLTPLFASAGIAGIAVALAAKDTLANFFGGISIFADRSFKVGDYIILGQGERGEVVDIGIRSTRIKTRDDVLVTIPNSILANSKIINESAPIPRFRIRIPVGVAYGSDLDQVERLLVDVAKANAMVSKALEPRARLRVFADSSVNFELLCWVDDPAHKGLVTHQLLGTLYRAFAEAGISIPFPQRDVHFYPGASLEVVRAPAGEG